jgi:hypothetical protein
MPGPGKYSSTVFLAVLMGSVSALAQISPGALSRAHSSLDRATLCTKCHALGPGSSLFKCLDCHGEIRQRLDEKHGLHPSLIGSEDRDRACASCHSEHNGGDYELIRWDPPQSSFDHSKTGYVLRGRHSALPCRDCHQPSRIQAKAAEDIKIKDHQRTFLGLGRDCLSCHNDQHRGQLSAQCDTCHNNTRWQDALKYDHSKSRFPLVGSHEKVECRKCHPAQAEPRPYLKYRDLTYETCTPCHEDPHHAAFPVGCKECHSPVSWKPVVMSAAFDHARSRFPLEGKHIGLPCKSCHRKSDFKAPVAHARCSDCHKPNPHKDQFAKRADGGECAACHKVSGFKPATFDVARHRLSPYPLEERHMAVRCQQCHTPQGAATVYRMADTRCSSCHKEAHAGQFHQPPLQGRCESCHTVKAFSPSTFTPVRHRSARFTLPGAHIAVACIECHKRKKGDPISSVSYRRDSLSCPTCHTDLHRGQFSVRMTLTGPDGAARDCMACHNTTSWNQLSGFDHQSTNFVLSGRHSQVPCDRCHRRGEPKPDIGSIVFRETPHKCSACHADQHGGQFIENGIADCTRCHSEKGWKPSLFDHDTKSNYPLTGAHRDARCTVCHTSTREVGGKIVISYRGLPRTCSACHRSKAPGNV